MCGIAGKTGYVNETVTNQTVELLKHRGPDANGSYRSEACSLIHTRLSIIDLDERSNQPMWDSEKKYAIVYNGEIYNYKNLREELEKEYEFKTNSDTEVILNGYKKYGHTVWEKLSGMFAVCIYDTVKQRLILARDHAGIKPLYYAVHDNILHFSSEMKPLVSLMKGYDSEKNVNLKSVYTYLGLGCVPAPTTMFNNVFVLEKSTFVEFDLHSKELNKQKYTPLSKEITTIDDLKSVIEDSVAKHLISDVPVALFFSGGTDSSLLAAILKKQKHPLVGYNLQLPNGSIDREYSDKINRYLGMECRDYEFDLDAFERSYHDVVEHISTPLADVSIFPTHYIAKKASEEFKVVLSGEGGDELFFGYPRQSHLFNKEKKNLIFQKLLVTAFTYSPNFRGKTNVYRKVAEIGGDIASYYFSIMTPSGSFAPERSVREAIRYINNVNVPGHDYDREILLTSSLLLKLDAATMLNSLEGRVPLLDSVLYQNHNFFSTVGQPTQSNLKPLLKQILSEYLPQEYVYRKKRGFGFDITEYADALSSVKIDFYESYDFFKEFVPELKNKDPEVIFKRNKGYATTLIMGYKSIYNVSRV